MKYIALSSRNGPSNHWIKLAAASLMAVAIAGCGGGGNRANTTVVSNTATNTTTTAVAAESWRTMAPQITVKSVVIPATGAGNPVVQFSVKDAAGNPVLGLANYSQSATATAKGLTNLGFTLAKLVPGTNGDPSKWVSYNVIKTPTVAQKAGTVAANASCNQVAATATAAAVPPTWCGTWPATDAQGTLVDNGDGSYQYTFLRDVKQVAAVVAALNNSTDRFSLKNELGDVSYDPTLTHRLGIQLGGNAPGTGNNTPNAATLVPAVAMVNTANAVYDFRPDGLAVAATRDVVSMASCGSCHQSKVLAHGSRKDPNYCVTCHTDQARFSINGEAATGDVLANTAAVPPQAAASAPFGLTGKTSTTTSVVGGYSLVDFPNMVHKIHMGKLLVKQGYNFIPGTTGNGLKFNNLAIPQDVRNCATCHTQAATANAVPSALACGSCHDGIDFKTGKGATIANKKADVTAKVAIGTTQSNHPAGILADNSKCATCHSPSENALYHGNTAAVTTPTSGTTALPRAPIATANSPVLRTFTAAISAVVVDANGGVTATFTVKDGTTPVTDMTKFTKPSFGLVKLVPAANGSSSHWVSYTSTFRTKSATMPPVLQGRTENGGTLTANADGSFSYKFALLNGSTPGDIRTITHAHNASTQSATAPIPAEFVGTAWNPTSATGAGTGPAVVAYEPTLTHRVAMTFQKVGVPNVDNLSNAYFDFVPAGGAVITTRNIVTMTNCASCHNNQKLHAGYDTQLCVVCHNSSTGDPFTGDTVDLQRLVHKLHMGSQLPSVIAGGSYVVNGVHDYSKVAYPGVIKNCVACHKETAKGPKGETLANAANWYTTPTKAACSGCHDAVTSVAHMDGAIVGGVETCTTCHRVNSTTGMDVKTAHSK